MQLLADAEGADHEIAISVHNAASEDDAVEVGRSVARSNLFKAAVFGKDPNWGRVLASIGTTGAAFDPADLDVAMNGVWVCRRSTPAADPTTVDLSARDVTVTIDLKAGVRPRHRLDQRPHARLRPREQRLLLMTTHARRHARRRPALAQALPRQDRGGEVRRQRHDRRHPQDRLRRGHRLPAVRRLQAGRRARRRPADLDDARPAGHRSRSSAAGCGSPRPRRWTSSGWCSSARCSASWSG